MYLLAKVRNYFLKESPLGKMADYANDDWTFIIAQILVRVYYFFLLYSSISLFPQWDLPNGPQTYLSLQLPISWLQITGFPLGVAIIKVSFIVTSIFASIAPQRRFLRILSFITLVEFVSLYFSASQPDIDWYAIQLTSFFLIFLPDRWGNPFNFPSIERQKFLLVFWGCQAINLLTYTMSGIGKIYAAIIQIMAGQSNVFDPKALALHIANRSIMTGRSSPLAHWVVDHYFITWPFFIAAIYLLLFSFAVAFRPKIHRIWGIGLILFHVISYLTLDVMFDVHIFLISLLLLLSPYAPIKISLHDLIRNLPILDLIVKFSIDRKK